MVLYFGKQDFMRQLVEKLLKQVPISVHTEKEAEGKSYLLEDLSCTLVLVDSEGSLESDGLWDEVLPKIQQLKIPIAAIGEKDDLEKWTSKGVTPVLFLEKPVTPKELVAKIKALLLN